MKKVNYLFVVFVLLLLFSSCQKDRFMDSVPVETELKSSNADKTKLTGFDDWGFNFTAQIFEGYLINAMFGDPVFKGQEHFKEMVYHGEGISFWEEVLVNYPYFQYMMPSGLLDCKLKMKWNSELLSREGIYPSTWIDSNAWIVFHYKMNTDDQQWTQIRTLVALKSSYVLNNGLWYNENGDEVGKQSYYWPELMITKVINNGDNPFVPMAMPADYRSPNGAGMGKP